jgi:hypothetical protein
MEVTIERAKRILEAQQRANKKYYAVNKEAVKKRSLAYWEANREAINERRRLRYQAAKEKDSVDGGVE